MAKPNNSQQTPPAADETTEAAEFVLLSMPLPGGIPGEMLKLASIVVKSKSESGRRRAGHAFTREETTIAYADLSEAQIADLAADPGLIVSVRLPKKI